MRDEAQAALARDVGRDRALVVGLTGSAVALQGKNSVKSNDIAPSAVKGYRHRTGSRSIQPTSTCSRPRAWSARCSTASKAPTDLGGPSVTIQVPRPAWWRSTPGCTGEIDGGGQNALAQMHLYEPTLFPNAPRILEFNSSDPQLRISTPGTGNLDGTASLTRGGWIVFPGEQGQVHVLALLQRRRRRDRHLHQRGPLGRRGRLGAGAS